MSKLRPFEEIFQPSERRLIEQWATNQSKPRERPFRIMETEFKYKLVHTHDGRNVESVIEHKDFITAQHFADALNKRFPTRHYRIVTIKKPRRAQ